MPTITLNRKVFENLVGKKLPDKELRERISYLGTDLDSVDKDEIIVEIFPNRPDMLSEQGFARAFSSFMGVKTGLRKYKIKESELKVFAKNLPPEWPYAAAAVAKNVKLSDEKIREIIQIQEKMDATLFRRRKSGGIGFYPLGKIKFPVTFTGEDPKKIKFRPLEYPAELTARQILEHHPTGRKYRHLCEHWKRFTVFRDSRGVTMSMPPIINSHETGKIDEDTKEMFIEATGNNLESVRTSINIIATMLADMGAEVYSVEMVYPGTKFRSPDLTPKKMEIDRNYVNRLLGLELSEKQISSMLEKMGYGYEKGKVLVPAYRADVMHMMDLVEDIAIAYGYDKFQPAVPSISTIAQEDEFSVFKRKVARVMTGLGMLETSTYHLTKEENMNKKMLSGMKFIEIENAKNSDHDILRSWIIPSLMEVLGKNTRHEYPQSIFEIGGCFKKGGGETGVEEFSRLGASLSGKDITFTDIKQVLDFLFSSLGMKYEIEETEHPSFIPGRVGRVSVKGKGVAYIGEIHPQVLENWGIGQPVSCFELNLTDLFSLTKK